MGADQRIRAFVDGLARRWHRLAVRRLVTLACLGVGLLWLAALVAWWLVGRVSAVAQVPLVAIALAATVAWLVWVVWRRPAPPSFGELSRLVEDRYPGLEDRLVTAVDLIALRRTHGGGGALDEGLLADTASRLDGLDPDHIVPRAAIRRAGRQALAAVALVAVAGAVAWVPATRAFQAAWLFVSPDRLVLEVQPGAARVPPQTPFTVTVRTTAAAGGLVPELHVRVGEASRSVRMKSDGGDRFTFGFESVPASFAYRVSVAGQQSPEYAVTLLEPPRVERIDLTYEYPAFTGMAPRTEDDGGDIYAPEGTTVRFRVHPRTTTAPIVEAGLGLTEGEPVPLQVEPDGTWSGTLTLEQATAYRVRLRDADGLENTDDPEYYVRLLDDRPPDVRILRPAGDRQVTPLEEVTIEARADDDHGLTSFELVYGVRGEDERAVPLGNNSGAMSLTGRLTIYLEELAVAPGDFVSFYARAKDVGRGKRPTEAQSDIFFLEVTPFVDEFALAQSQAMAAAAGNSQGMDDLVRIQKDIIVGTWKLEKRAAGQDRAPSSRDARTLGRAQSALQQRTEMAARQADMFGAMRSRTEEVEEVSALGEAAAAMTRAAGALEAVKIAGALPAEMEALNHLLRAQAEVRRKQIARQQAGAGGGGFNRSQQDLSSLFDRELRRQQQTNYETPQTAQEQRDQPGDELLERVRELARRQEALAREQSDLARQGQELEEEERRRRLERLSRDQTELQRQAAELARQLARTDRQQSSEAASSTPPGGASQQGQPSDRTGGEQQGNSASGQQSGSSSGGQSGSRASAMREASEAMKNAASELRREEAEAARERSARAVERLREVERQMKATGPDQRRRALGDAQLEARQMADRQRQLGEQAARAGEGATDDQRRQMAGEQRQMAERAEGLTRRLDALARGALAEPSAGEPDGLEKALRSLESAQLGERMREVAEGIEQGRAGAARGEPQRELARTLDRLADEVAGTTSGRDQEGEQLASELSRARELREQLAALERQMQAIARDPEGSETSGRGAEAQARRLADLRREYAEQAARAGELGRALGSENPGAGRGMSTPEGQERVSSAPGTEAFKQDFAKWETLHRDVTLGLERLEAALSRRLLEKAARDRLRTGSADATPDEYRTVVERYYRTLASDPR